jgi:hypothetical protein
MVRPCAKRTSVVESAISMAATLLLHAASRSWSGMKAISRVPHRPTQARESADHGGAEGDERKGEYKRSAVDRGANWT